jgi:hypothetical protein
MRAPKVLSPEELETIRSHWEPYQPYCGHTAGHTGCALAVDILLAHCAGVKIRMRWMLVAFLVIADVGAVAAYLLGRSH